MSVDEYDSVIACDPYGPTGYVLEVDLYYPSSLHAAHYDFQLASHHLDVDYSMLSPYAQSLAPHTHKTRKLCQSFLPKIKYTLHLRNLQQYLSLGLWHFFTIVSGKYFKE